MTELSDFESTLIKLQWVKNRLMPIFELFPQIKDDAFGDPFRRVLRETIVVQLHNFIRIRENLIKETKIQELDNCLEPLWDPIINLEIPIKKLRNQYIAHIQEEEKPFKIMPGDIIFSHDVPSTYGDWLFLAGCAASYCELVYVNMKSEWDKAEQKYRALTPFPESHGLITLKNYRQKTKLAYKNTLKNLQKKGFVDSDKFFV
ncbi:MAG: hypothetical protein OEL52_05235 [Nitrosopumilus sp.]|nr:hypothetical protein [Nitrosopumilus sp.]MDH3824925.1 hypothetical protein [Nitrosopumilus sp.]